jgi:hypothetical protein
MVGINLVCNFISMKSIVSSLAFIFLFVQSFAQTGPYARISVVASESQLSTMLNQGVDLEHYHPKPDKPFIGEFSKEEQQLIGSTGAQIKILVADLEKYYPEQNQLQKSTSVSALPAGFNYGSMGGYLTFDEMVSELDSMFLSYPNLITQKVSIGTSIEGRDIWMVKISDNPTVQENEPEVLYTSIHHAREPISMVQNIYFMQYLLEQYAINPEISCLIDNRQLYFVPVINPDGYVYNETTNPSGGGMWRKNRRDNLDGTFGVDLNRNYGYNWGIDNIGSSDQGNSETFRGDSAFSEPETQAIRDFCNAHDFVFALNYHAFGNYILYPWGYNATAVNPEQSYFSGCADEMTSVNNYASGNCFSTLGYLANGGSDDWLYGEQTTKPKIYAYTPEVGEQFWPPQSDILGMCEENILQNIRTADFSGEFINGGNALSAYVSSQNFNWPFIFTSLGVVASGVSTAELIPVNAQISSVNNTLSIPALSPLSVYLDSFDVTLSPSVNPGDDVFALLKITLSTGCVVTDTISFTFGEPVVIFSDSLNTHQFWNGWFITGSNYYSASNSMTDSPSGSYYPNDVNETKSSINVNTTGYVKPFVQFRATWDIESGYDYVTFGVLNASSSIIPLVGNYTQPGSIYQNYLPVYDGNQSSWVLAHVDISAYSSANLNFGFGLYSDNAVELDGYYFDDFTVLGYAPSTGFDETQSSSLPITVYPNPASSIINFSNEVASCILSDLSGKILFQCSGKMKQIELPETINNGLYLLNLKTENNHQTNVKLSINR